MSDIYLEMECISKLYPGVKALDNVSIKIQEGEIIALLGENGAGKSTLMNVLGGVIKRDTGNITVNGDLAEINTVADSQRLGIAFIHQELSLFQHLKVYENLFIEHMEHKKRTPFLDRKKMIQDSKKIMDRLGMDISPTETVRDLPMGQQQITEIAAAILKDSKIIILDEPTTSLTNKEREKLFEIMQILKSEKKCIIFITHDLDDALNNCDRYYVLRNGKRVGDGRCSEIDREGIVQLMIGSQSNKKFIKSDHDIKNEIVLEIKNLNTEKIKDVSLTLKKGEVLGLYGLVGSGRSEIVHAMYGLDKIESGKIYIQGHEVENSNPAKMKNLGVAYLTENRRDDGLFLLQSLNMNISVTALNKIKGRFGLISMKKDLKTADEMIDKLGISTPTNTQLVGRLSGGNQQKVVIGKWLHLDPEIFILDEPTKGIDVGAKTEIYKLIDQIVKSGSSVILISSEIEEIMGLSDRVGVMARGSMVGFLQNSEITKDNIVHYTMS